MTVRDKRRFERVPIPQGANVRITTTGGRDLGPVLVLGHGGMLVATEEKFPRGKMCKLVLTDEAHGIATPIVAQQRYRLPARHAFKFVRLSAEAAVDIGVILGAQLGRKRTRAATAR
jgi:hypothetical protein